MENTDEIRIERLLIGVSGSVGIVNLIPYVIEWKKNNWVKEVRVILTKMASTFIPPYTISLFCNEVHTEMVDFREEKTKHIELASWAQLLLIMPASANNIGKVANGIADDLLTTTIIASSSPTVFVPNMNSNMYTKPVVQRNLEKLRMDGYYVINPIRQKTYQVSVGAMVETLSMPQPQMMLREVWNILQSHQSGNRY